MKNPRWAVLASMVAGAALLRLLPHPWNFTPVAAMALFGGARFQTRLAAFTVPLAAMALSDLVLGLHVTLPAVYLSFALTVMIGRRLRDGAGWMKVGGGAILSSVLFFVVTNFAHWALTGIYPKTAAGLSACFIVAVPYFRNMLAGDLFYTALLFGGFHLAQRAFPVLRAGPVPAH